MCQRFALMTVRWIGVVMSVWVHRRVSESLFSLRAAGRTRQATSPQGGGIRAPRQPKAHIHNTTRGARCPGENVLTFRGAAAAQILMGALSVE